MTHVPQLEITGPIPGTGANPMPRCSPTSTATSRRSTSSRATPGPTAPSASWRGRCLDGRAGRDRPVQDPGPRPATGRPGGLQRHGGRRVVQRHRGRRRRPRLRVPVPGAAQPGLRLRRRLRPAGGHRRRPARLDIPGVPTMARKPLNESDPERYGRSPTPATATPTTSSPRSRARRPPGRPARRDGGPTTCSPSASPSRPSAW